MDNETFMCVLKNYPTTTIKTVNALDNDNGIRNFPKQSKSNWHSIEKKRTKKATVIAIYFQIHSNDRIIAHIQKILNI